MEYNTTRDKLILPEYGRNIQKMVQYALTIEDREMRNKAAKAIVAAMGQINHQNKDTADFKRKLWDHLFIISEFKLDVDSPYPKPDPNQFVNVKPQKVSYQNNNIKFKHYGYNIQRIIEKVSEYPEGEEKEALIIHCANTLKKMYMIWNRETIPDETIASHLEILSNGKLKLKESVKLEQLQSLKNKKRKFNNGNKYNNTYNQKNYKNQKKNKS
ncbi:MAG TPA: DUF4290 domain-containing protein [Bacteroidales bacterium]|nr:DUF4290 domain-containing protein [Bacteroidales bacterium]